MTEIVQRLRKVVGDLPPAGHPALAIEAADEIERLQKLIYSAERELENVLVSMNRIGPDKLMNPVLRDLRAERKE